jgi:catalase
MASTIAESVRKVGDSVADSVTTMSENKKIADLQRNMKDQNTKQNTTTDYGAQVPDLDHWLKTVDDKNQKIGPHLLEDHTGRERVCRTKLPMFFSNVR